MMMMTKRYQDHGRHLLFLLSEKGNIVTTQERDWEKGEGNESLPPPKKLYIICCVLPLQVSGILHKKKSVVVVVLCAVLIVCMY